MPPTTPVALPIAVSLPRRGVFFAESVHDPRFEMAWRSDPFHKCIYVLHGATALKERSIPRERLLARRSLVAIPAGTEHRLCDAEPSALLLLCLARDFVDSDREMASLWHAISRANDRIYRLSQGWQHRLENLWRQAIFEQTAEQLGCRVAVKSMAAQVLLHLARLPANKSHDDVEKRIEFVIREMAESFFDGWNLDRAAARAEMSRRAFSAHFHQHTGQTFLKRLTELRLNHAAQLLRDGESSVIGAAFSSGYQDLSHFYRLFRQRYGIAPKAWATRPQRRSSL